METSLSQGNRVTNFKKKVTMTKTLNSVVTVPEMAFFELLKVIEPSLPTPSPKLVET
jgi:hypothetical protein